MAKKTRITRGSGNVFADLGLPNPEQELLKAQLSLQIYRIVKQRGLTQAQAASVLGIKQPHVSALLRNRAGNFSVGRLMEFLTALGQDVRVTVRADSEAGGGNGGGGRLIWRAPGSVPHTFRAGPQGARILDIFSPPRAEYRKAGRGFG